jgi:hypothetical protein
MVHAIGNFLTSWLSLFRLFLFSFLFFSFLSPFLTFRHLLKKCRLLWLQKKNVQNVSLGGRSWQRRLRHDDVSNGNFYEKISSKTNSKGHVRTGQLQVLAPSLLYVFFKWI